jgi:hypothetical protein
VASAQPQYGFQASKGDRSDLAMEGKPAEASTPNPHFLDERLWAEALNLGAWGVLARPFDRPKYSAVFNRAGSVGTTVWRLPMSWQRPVEARIRSTFGKQGAVRRSKMMTDRWTGLSRGFGFIEMKAGTQAEEAIVALNGTDLNGKLPTANHVRPQLHRQVRGKSKVEGS